MTEYRKNPSFSLSPYAQGVIDKMLKSNPHLRGNRSAAVELALEFYDRIGAPPLMISNSANTNNEERLREFMMGRSTEGQKEPALLVVIP